MWQWCLRKTCVGSPALPLLLAAQSAVDSPLRRHRMALCAGDETKQKTCAKRPASSADGMGKQFKRRIASVFSPSWPGPMLSDQHEQLYNSVLQGLRICRLQQREASASRPSLRVNVVMPGCSPLPMVRAAFDAHRNKTPKVIALHSHHGESAAAIAAAVPHPPKQITSLSAATFPGACTCLTKLKASQNAYLTMRNCICLIAITENNIHNTHKTYGASSGCQLALWHVCGSTLPYTSVDNIVRYVKSHAPKTLVLHSTCGLKNLRASVSTALPEHYVMALSFNASDVGEPWQHAVSLLVVGTKESQCLRQMLTSQLCSRVAKSQCYLHAHDDPLLLGYRAAIQFRTSLHESRKKKRLANTGSEDTTDAPAENHRAAFQEALDIFTEKAKDLQQLPPEWSRPPYESLPTLADVPQTPARTLGMLTLRALVLKYWVDRQQASNGMTDAALECGPIHSDGSCPEVRPKSVLLYYERSAGTFRRILPYEIFCMKGYPDNSVNLGFVTTEAGEHAASDAMSARVASLICIAAADEE